MRRYIGLLLLLFLALSGCNQSGFGIFYSVGIEEAYLDNKSLDNQLGISEFIATTDSYFALAGKLYVRDAVVVNEAEADWPEIAPPTDTVIVAMSNIGDDIYAVIAAIDGTSSGLYKLNATGVAGAKTFSWSDRIDVDGNGDVTEYVSSVFNYGASLGVSLELTDFEFATYVSSDGATYSAITLPVTTIEADKAVIFGGATYVLALNRVYTNGSGSFAAVTETNSPGVAETVLSDIFVSTDLGGMFVIAQDGSLYIHDGTNWLDPVEVFADDSIPGSQTTILFAVQVGTGETILLIGTNSGYLEIVISDVLDQADFTNPSETDLFVNIPATEEITTSGIDYTAVDLETTVVLDFDLAGNYLYASTAGTGLWKIDFTSTDRRWSRE